MHESERVRVPVRVRISATLGWARTCTVGKDLECPAACGVSPPHKPRDPSLCFLSSCISFSIFVQMKMTGP